VNLEYEIKELKKEDLAEDKDGFLETLGNLSETEEISLEDAEKILFEINSNNGTIYIAKTFDGKIIGTAKLLIEKNLLTAEGKLGILKMLQLEKNTKGMELQLK